MTRFIYVADSHVGAGEAGYHQQPRYADRLPELAALLDAWIQQDGDIDFVLHGGDMVDAASVDNIRAARALFQLSVPVYLCLGNHDLTEEGALDMWLSEASAFFHDPDPVFTVRGAGCFVHVAPVQWCDTPYFWHDEQRPHFLPGHLERVSAVIAENPDAVHVLCVHADVFGIPPGQTGFDVVYHAPMDAYTQTVLDFTRRHPQIRCVLAAHNHINSCVMYEGVPFVTVSAFAETSFEFKVIEVEVGKVTMTTHNLSPDVSFKAAYDYDKTFVQGRKKDRAFALRYDTGKIAQRRRGAEFMACGGDNDD